MVRERPRRPSRVPFLVLGVLVVAGSIGVWKLRPSSRGPSSPVHDVEVDRRHAAALDPSFDPARPAGAIEGSVRDADGKPVDGAVVAITRSRGRDDPPTFIRPVPRTTITAGGGRFRLAEVLAGEYGVTATSLEGEPARQSKVEVAPGKTAQVLLTLGKGGSVLTGEVQDVGGGPVAGAKAALRAIRSFGRPGEETAWFQVASDDKGVFKVRLAAGEYDLGVRAEGYAPARDYLVLRKEPQSRRYRLNPAARLAGRVLDGQTREPVAGASVWLRLDRLESYVDREVTSDGAGQFSFDDLAAGGYVVLARAQQATGLSRTVSVGIAQAVTGVDVLVERGRAIRGTVVGSDGKGLEGVRIMVTRADPPYERPVFGRSTAGGSFALGGLLPAKYRISGWLEGKGTSRPETAQITSQDVEGIRLAMTALTVVRGQVVDQAGSPVPEAAVTGAVEVKGADRRMNLDRATTDSAGKFELTRLMPGTVTVTARHADRGAATWGPEELSADPPPLTLRLESAATISGTVKFDDGAPAPRVVVFAPPAQQSTRLFMPPEQAFTDEAGRYRIGGLERGSYMVMARRGDTFGGNPRSRQQVTLAAGEQKSGVDLVVPTGGKRIAGTVVGADGKPVNGAIVTGGLEREGFAFRMPLREGGGPLGGGSAYAVSDHDGAFTIEDLQDGVYTVWATDATHADGERKGVAAGSTAVSIRLAEGASLAGVVRTREGAPVSDYSIAALPGSRPGASPDEKFRFQMTARMWSPSAQVHDPSGAFSIARLAAGAYELTVTTADGQGGLLPVNVGAGENKTGLTIVIDAGAKVRGRVVELDGGDPLEGVAVNVASATRQLNVSTGKDGSFTLTGLAPGRARVDFRVGDGQLYVSEHTEVDVKPGAADIDVGLIKLLKRNTRDKGNPFDRGRVGFTVALLDGRPSVTGVIPGFPGSRAGLKEGDLVLAVNGKPLDGLGNGALDYLASGKLDEPLKVKIQPKQGGPAVDLTIDRVPLDYDPSRPGIARDRPESNLGATSSTATTSGR
jgi:hypothetical protein